MSNDSNNLDEFLDSVLDEFDDISTNTASNSTAVVARPNEVAPSTDAGASLQRDIEQFVSQLQSGTLPAINEESPSQMQKDAQDINALFAKLMGSMPLDDSAIGTASKPKSVKESLDEAVRMVGPGNTPKPGVDLGEDGDDIIRKLMEEFKVGEDDANLEQSVEKMMSQMLSKETLYEPIKQVTEKYPLWLAEHGGQLSLDQRVNYEKQHAVFQRMCLMFEAGEGSSAEIMAMMGEMQSFGQPPAEIMQELVPGLEFNAEGEPNLTNIPPELSALQGDVPNCTAM